MALFLSGSVAAQGLAALTGLLLARWLSIEDYALYTIAFLLMGAINVLTKGGVHLGFTAILGRTWPDLERAAQAVSSALKARRTLSSLVLPPFFIASALLLYQNGSTPLQVGLLISLLLMFWLADMRTSVVDQIFFFAKQTTRIQGLDLALAFARLAVVLGLFAAGWLNLISAIFLAVLLAWLRVRPIMHWTSQILPMDRAKSQASDFQEMRQSVYRQFPSDLFQVFQVQIVILMMTAYATTSDIAGYGALSRLQQLTLPALSIMHAFAVPYFARTRQHVLPIYLALIALSSLPGIALVIVAWMVPEWLLWLIGNNYASLSHEVLMASVATAFSNIAMVAWTLVANRGWLKWSWLQIPLGLLWCVVAPVYLLDMSRLEDALVFRTGFALALLAAAGMGMYSAWHEPRWEPNGEK